MQLYSEIYNCYYNIIHNLLSRNAPFSKEELISVVSREGFDETMLYLIPKLDSGEWNFFKKEDDLYVSTLHNKPDLVLSTLQKRWLKTLLLEPRIRLFLDDDALTSIQTALDGVEPLYNGADFYVYDRFADGDDYADENYRKNFRTILSAIESGQYLNISFNTHRNNRLHYWYLPCKLEYSVKNDRFRLLALEARKRSHFRLHIINLSRMDEIKETGKYAREIPDINAYITKEYDEKPVTLLITNERNALERAMLQFANYKKNTVRIDENTYKCKIYYNKSNETELLIEVLSFGPAIKVIGNGHFLELLKKRLLCQRDLLA
ncbi:MAG: WYL domain-containing protein [Lachnospiraceae bacterium]|nr:WYL domain-containing protein [Lachnospiraceae bacterium]